MHIYVPTTNFLFLFSGSDSGISTYSGIEDCKFCVPNQKSTDLKQHEQIWLLHSPKLKNKEKKAEVFDQVNKNCLKNLQNFNQNYGESFFTKRKLKPWNRSIEEK